MEDFARDGELPRAPSPSERWVRIVEVHSGVGDVLGSEASLGTLLDAISSRLEAGRVGARYPLVRLLSRRGPVTAGECDALSREVVRVRAGLERESADWLRGPPAGGEADPVLGAALPLDRMPEPFRRLNGNGGTGGNGVPKTLAEAFAWPLSVVESVTRLGSASRRGVRLEIVPTEPAIEAPTTRDVGAPHSTVAG